MCDIMMEGKYLLRVRMKFVPQKILGRWIAVDEEKHVTLAMRKTQNV
jgi:hypothetical protein